MAPSKGPGFVRPPASLNGADCGSSAAKHLTVQDMMDGLVPFDQNIKNIRKLFDDMHSHQPEFKDFPFDHERYKARIKRVQVAVKRVKWASQCDKECLEEARKMHPKQTHGPTGEILWEGSEAALQLDIDMAAGKHLTIKPSQLRATKACYQPFSARRFSKRIDQKKEAAKPCGMNPMQAAARREQKQRQKVKNRPQISRAGDISAYENEA